MKRLTVFDGEFWLHKDFPPVREDTVDEFVDCVKDMASRLASIENILGDDYDLDRLKELVEADRDGRCVVFPCKVGDTLYRIGYTTCKNGETHPDGYGCCGCCDECDMKKCVKEFIIPDSQWILSNYTNIVGGDWYSTREAVEVALERMEREEK